MATRIESTFSPLVKIMTRWPYFVLALLFSTLLFVFAIWLPNLSFVKSIIVSQDVSLVYKASVLIQSLQAFQTNFTLFGQIVLVIVSLLFGLNVSLFSFYIRNRMRLQKEAGMGLGGIIIGMFGIGCVSCGSFLFASLFGTSASIAFLGFLPFRGQEFAVISIIILVFSITATAKKIKEPLVCK